MITGLRPGQLAIPDFASALSSWGVRSWTSRTVAQYSGGMR